MAGLRVFLLGAPRFELDGETLALGRKKVIALLAYITVTARQHNRDALAALFWPEYDQSGARANLRRDISRARKSVGDEAMLVEGDQVGLEPGYPVWSDVTEFQKLVAVAQEHGHTLRTGSSPLCDPCAQALSQAVELYQGDFMAGFSLPDSAPFDDWQFFQNEGYRQQLAEALQHLVHWHTRKGEFERAIEYARQWTALDTLHELAHRQLMKLYAWSGQQAAALRQYQDLTQMLRRELGVEPDDETRQVYEAIRARKLDSPAEIETRPLEPPETVAGGLAPTPALPSGTALQNNLPEQTTQFVGRQKELRQIFTYLMEDPTGRVITLLGPGGSGKTRLGIQAAKELSKQSQELFPDGIWFVPLAPLSEPESIVPAISQAVNLSVHSEAEKPEQQLLDYLSRKKLMLLLDNFEHLLGTNSRAFTDRLISEAPGVKILVTSRVRLNTRGERVFPVEGLDLPSPTIIHNLIEENRIDEYSALRLFAQCARRVDPNFTITVKNAPAVLRICQLLEGMPLGIELAAAWLEMLNPQEVAAEIEKSLDFLETDWHDMPDRQRSLRAVFNSSWQLLNAQEQKVISSLAIFAGSFSREAAQTVSGASLRDLLGLVHKSWLQRTSEERFLIHELLRQYAHEKLAEDQNNWDQARMRHATYFADYLSGQNQYMQGSKQREAFENIKLEFDNIRAAWLWLVEVGQLELLVYWILPAVYRYCEARARAAELLPLVRRAQEKLASQVDEYHAEYIQPILLTAQGAFYANTYPVRYESFGNVTPANREAIEKAWQQMSSLDTRRGLEFWEIMLTYLYGRIVDRDAGINRLKDLIPQYRDQSQRWETAFALAMLSQLHLLLLSGTEEMELTDGYLQEALETFIELGDEREAGHTLREFGNLRRFQHRYEQAVECWISAQLKLNEVGDWAIANDIHWQIGDLFLDQGKFDLAFDHYRAMSDTYVERGYKWLAANILSKESYEALRYGDFKRAWDTRQLSLKYCREDGDTYGEAWSTWELGEYFRVTGDLDAARQTFDKALHLFKQIGDPNGFTFFHRGFGDITLETGDYREAQRHFQLSQEFAEEAGHIWGLAYAICGSGWAALYLDEIEEATRYLALALRLSRRTEHRPLILHTLCGAAHLYAAREENALAVETATFLSGHYGTWHEDRQKAEKLLNKLEKTLSDQEYVAAVSRAGKRTLSDFQLV